MEQLISEVVDVKEDLYVLKMGRDPDLYGYDKKTMNVKFLIKDRQVGRWNPPCLVKCFRFSNVRREMRCDK